MKSILVIYKHNIFILCNYSSLYPFLNLGRQVDLGFLYSMFINKKTSFLFYIDMIVINSVTCFGMELVLVWKKITRMRSWQKCSSLRNKK